MSDPSPSALYLALVDPETEFDDEVHNVFDLTVLGFRLDHAEGEFAVLEVIVENPGVSPLAPGRKQWAWFSMEFDGLGVVPKFYGRIHVVPDDLNLAEVTYVFRARPVDYDAVKRALAETLRVTPYWDKVWHREEDWDDPDLVLDARPARYHIDPVTHAVTISDMITGEDGTVALDGDDVFSAGITFGERPLRAFKMTAGVDWTQAAAGRVDATDALVAAFKAEDSGGSSRIRTYTGRGLEGDWPKEGDSIGAGWSFGECSLRRADGIATEVSIYVVQGITASLRAGINLWGYPEYHFPLWTFWPQLEFAYDIERSYTEAVTFTLRAGVQAVDVDPDGEDVIDLTLNSTHVGEPIDPDGALPIGDVRRRSYFATARGKVSLEWLICRARRELLVRARACQVSVETTLRTGLDFGLRKNASVAHSSLDVVGGSATGKIIAYSLWGDPQSGDFGASAVIGCCVGKGETVSEDPGTPTYVEEGYVETGYQVYEGQTIAPVAGEVTYETFTVTPDDDGINFFNMTPESVLIRDEDGDLFTVEGAQNQQEAVLDAGDIFGAPTLGYASQHAAGAALDAIYTRFCYNLVPLNIDPVETNVPVTVSRLSIPQGIDLGAGA